MKVLILTEGGRKIGFGHINRCLSLYAAFQDKGISPEIMISCDSSLKDAMRSKNYKVCDWLKDIGRTLDAAGNPDMVIVDSYLALPDLYQKVSAAVKTPVYIDDNKRLEYPSGVVLNGNIYANDLDYPASRCIRYLLGADYTPLRREFCSLRRRIIKRDVKSILVTTGGDDVKNLTPKILKLLARIYPGLIKKVIVSKAFRNLTEIRKAKDKMTELIVSPSPGYLKELMFFVDVAISGGGQTLYELACLGTPAIGICIDKDQENNIAAFSRRGLCLNSGGAISASLKPNLDILFSNHRVREAMSGRQRRSIDGLGAKRVVNELLS